MDRKMGSPTLQPLFDPSVGSLCHPWFTTTNRSYRFSIFETSATTLCGTTGIYNTYFIVVCTHIFIPNSLWLLDTFNIFQHFGLLKWFAVFSWNFDCEVSRLRDLDKVRWNSILEFQCRFPLPEAWVYICRWFCEPSMSWREHQWQCCFLLLRLYCINGWLQGKLSQDSRLRWHRIHQQPVWGLDPPWRHQGRQGNYRIHLLEISWWIACRSQHKAGAGCSLLDSVYLWTYFSHPGWTGVYNLWWLDPKANVPAT